MTSKQRQLVSRFESLPENLQSVLELLSTAYFPKTRTRVLNLVNEQSSLRPTPDPPLTFGEWRPIVSQLLDMELLVEQKVRIQCNPLIKEAALSSAAQAGRLDRWILATRRLFVEHPYQIRTSPYGHDVTGIFLDLRNAFHQNDKLEFQKQWNQWKKAQSGGPEPCDPIALLGCHPFDKNWMYSRDPSIRDTMLPKLIPPLLNSLSSATDQIEVARRVLDEGPANPDLSCLVGEYHILRGDLDLAEKCLAKNPTWTAAALVGWIACIRGRRGAAVHHFKKAIRLYTKQTRSRLVVFPPHIGAIYVALLAGSGQTGACSTAHKYLKLAARKGLPWQVPLDTALKGVVYYAQSMNRRARKCAKQARTTSRLPGLCRVLAHAALAGIAPDTARSIRGGLEEVHVAAVKNGYRWVALEIARIERALYPSRPKKSSTPYRDLEDSCSPVFENFASQAPWLRTLKAMARVSEAGAGAAKAPSSRLTWRLGDMRFIQPYHQIRTKSGKWSRGRAVALKRLHRLEYDGPLTQRDQRISRCIRETRVASYYARSEFSFNLEKAFLALVGHPLVFRSDDPTIKVDVVNEEPRLTVKTKGQKVLLGITPTPPGGDQLVSRFESPSRFVVSFFGPSHRRIVELVGPEGLTVPLEAKPHVLRAISSASKLLPVDSDIGGGGGVATDVSSDPRTRFNITPYGDGLRVEPRVVPLTDGGPAYLPGEGGSTVLATVNGTPMQTVRDLREESLRLAASVSSCPTLGEASWDGNGWHLEAPDRCLELLDELYRIRDSVTVAWPRGEPLRVRHRATHKSLSLTIRSARDWFKVSGSVETDRGLVLDLKRVLASMTKADGRFVALGDGEYLALSKRFRSSIQQLATFTERRGRANEVRYHRSRAHLLEGLADSAGSLDVDATWKRLRRGFRAARTSDPPVPSTLQAELRDYQVLGYRWARRLAAWGAGACLADDMGLGKTVQALAVLLARAKQGPALVVAPTSVCPNWIEEAQRFTPTLRALLFGRGDRQDMLQRLAAFDVVICSYGLLRQEKDLMATVKWNTVVLDEAQAIKNRMTKVSKAAMGLSAEFRMITTGTPVENHLGELWNLFTFLNPGLLGSTTWFNREFATPIHQNGDLTRKSQLKHLIQPFLLRRTKTAVLDELPARTEITLRIEMSDPERALYEAVREQALESLAVPQGNGKGASHLQILAQIMRLRRTCCHPRLVLPDSEIPASKLAKFLQVVRDLMDGGHKALVFSQFVTHLAIVKEHLDDLGIRYRYLDGSTPAASRKREVDRFQGGDGDLFLISLRAGGQGLNLTAADYVVHLDPWWNPAVEDQASDRAHRIGQTRPVTIYRLVMRDTIEESILDLHRSKRDLADSLLEGSDVSGKMSADELLELIREA